MNKDIYPGSQEKQTSDDIDYSQPNPEWGSLYSYDNLMFEGLKNLLGDEEGFDAFIEKYIVGDSGEPTPSIDRSLEGVYSYVESKYQRRLEETREYEEERFAEIHNLVREHYDNGKEVVDSKLDALSPSLPGEYEYYKVDEESGAIAKSDDRYLLGMFELNDLVVTVTAEKKRWGVNSFVDIGYPDGSMMANVPKEANDMPPGVWRKGLTRSTIAIGTEVGNIYFNRSGDRVSVFGLEAKTVDPKQYAVRESSFGVQVSKAPEAGSQVSLGKASLRGARPTSSMDGEDIVRRSKAAAQAELDELYKKRGWGEAPRVE